MTIAPVDPPPVGGVLVASPCTSLREQVAGSFPSPPLTVQQVGGGAEALSKLESGDWQLLYLDRRLPDLDAEELLGIIKRRFPGIQVVLLDSDGPASPAEERSDPPPARGVHPPVAAVPRPRPDREDETPLPGMIGDSEAMRRLYRLARLVAARPSTVLILGATGTGKELVARALHRLSPRRARPLVVVNCAAIPETLLESELFGYARGAFTGAVQAQAGRIWAAQGGTLFLDEIGELPLAMQAKLLRFLEQKEVQRLGGSESVKVDVRVVAATNADLPEKVERNLFREDLYYRLAAFPLELPPLEQRRSDIVPLAQHFLLAAAEAANLPCPQLSPETCQRLERHKWRGNVRELQHIMERAAILAEGCAAVLPEHLYFSSSAAGFGAQALLRNEREIRERQSAVGL